MQPKPIRRAHWGLFFAALFAPPLLTALSVWGGSSTGGLAVGMALLGGGLGGLASGALLGRYLGKRADTQIGLGLLFGLVFGVLCIGMSFFGCLASGYKLDMR